MKKIFFVLLTLNVLMSSFLMGMTPPKPTRGSACIISGKNIHQFTVGNTQYLFKTPEGWGVGTMSLRPNAPSNVTLFPIQGGYGCTYEMEQYPSQEAAVEALNNIKKTFRPTNALDNGFTAKVKASWYCCTAVEGCVVQIWYSLPKKQKNGNAVWNSLKNALTVSKIETQKVDEIPPKDRPLVQRDWNQWICHHPENKFDVILNDCVLGASQNKDPNRLYLVTFSDIRVSGYFFVKWDQTDLTTTTPFAEHLAEINRDIQNDEPSQKFTGSVKYDLKGGYGIVTGSSYHIVTVAGNGFLFGFAFKPKNRFGNYDVNDLVQKVVWTNPVR